MSIRELVVDPDRLLAEWDNMGIGGDVLTKLVSDGTVNGLCNTLHPIAQKIDWAGTTMRERRRQAERIDPWRYGLLLAFLCQPVWEGLEDVVVSRFQVFQAAGYWEDREFNEWADEFTGVQTKTWMGWRHIANEYLLSPWGRGYLEQIGMTPAQFVESTTIDKALRACSAVVKKALQPHQLDALVNEDVTSEQMRHALRADADKWEEHVAAKEERDRDWVENGGGDSEPVLEYDPSQRVVRLKWINLDTGEVKSYTVMRLPMPGHDLVAQKQQEILDWMGV